MTEKRFQIQLNVAIAVLSFMLGSVATFVLEIRSERIQKSSMAKLIRTTVANDHRYTIDVTKGIRDRIKKKQFRESPTLFRLIYSPTVMLPSGDELGLLKPSVVTALDEYRRRLVECEKRRTEYVAILKAGSDDNIEMALFMYYVGLDSVVRTGTTLLSELDREYPDASHTAESFAPYSRTDEDMQELANCVHAATAERLKAKEAIGSNKK